MKVTYKQFYKKKCLDDAADFASKLKPERLINISDSLTMVVVWYWE